MNQTYQFLHNEITKLVDDLLLMNKELKAATVPAQQGQLRQRITYTSQCIDILVGQLYGLREEGIPLVAQQ